jgi:hypothetical protein
MSFTASYIRDAADENKVHLKIVRVATDVNKPPIVVNWGDGTAKQTLPTTASPATLADVIHTYATPGMRDIVIQESGGVRATLHVITGRFHIQDPEFRDKTQQQMWAKERQKARDIIGQMRTPS